ncbi:MAG: zinc-binding dehydrogenase [Alphaproteobacteria bacterium]|nr:zinc-binding dehydrogenase [Alphaproteobacteria bacterium]
MLAVAHAGGGPLRLETIPTPKPGPDEVLIKVAYAGLNRADLVQRAGFYPPPAGAPQTMGLEVSGEVVAVGAEASRWSVGAQVCALLAGGGYAQYAAVHEGSVLPVPKGYDLERAAALPEAIITVFANVFETCGLQPGEAFLVHGGASGIGTTAIQMAKAQGATVFATAGDADKVALCGRLGAARAINYKTEDFEEIVREAGGVDVILDMVGGTYVQKNINILKERGRLVHIAFLQGSRVEVDLMRMMIKRATITGTTLRARANAEKAQLCARVLEKVWPWVEIGRVAPVIDRVFAFDEADAAHARMQSGAHAGKILLRVA